MKRKDENSLKIAFVLDSTLDVEDGVQQYILTLGSWLQKSGHEVHYIVGESHRTDIQNMHSLARNLKVTFNGNKVSIPLPTGKKKVKSLLDKHNFDVLHIQVPYSPFYGAKFVKHSGPLTAVIGTFHILPYGQIAYIGTWILGRVLSSNLRRFNQQISISKANQVFSAKTFRTKSIVIPNMVNLKEFKPTNPKSPCKSKVQLLYLGRLTNRKGCEYLLEALATTLAKNPNLNFHLQIAGKGEKLEYLINLVSTLGLKGKVDFLGYVSNMEKVKLMQNADISVFPSFSGECFGIVLIEAMAAESGAVIGGLNPGYESVLGTIPESLVDVKDTEKFSLLLTKLIKDRKFRDSIFKKQQRIIGRYDYERVGSEILEVYKNCISKIND